MRKILLVDDQPHIIRVIRLSLERRGYDVEVANDGERALEKLRGTPFDVLITDIEMPRMNGAQLCEAMHATFPEEPPFTFIVTAKTEPELRDWAATLARTEFLEKPLSLRHLSARLDSYFSDGMRAAG